MAPSHTYRLRRQLGKGGQGSAWLAQAPDGSEVVVKRFEPAPGSSAEEVADARYRFVREYEMTTLLDHPNVVRIIAANMTADSPYYVMPVADDSMRKLLKDNASGLDLVVGLILFQRICEGMSYAHRMNMLHRDLKPENILMFAGSPRIADFGLGRVVDSDSATMTASKVGWGTWGYMSPEQMDKLHLAKEPADVYALGVILFEMLTPHHARDLQYKVDATPSEVRHIVQKCTQYDPADRYEDCEKLLFAVNKVLSQITDQSTSESPKAQVQSAVKAYLDSHWFDPDNSDRELERVAAVFEKYPNDTELFRTVLPSLQPAIILGISKDSALSMRFQSIVRDFDEGVARENTSFEYTDTIWKFYEKCFDAFKDFDFRSILLRRILSQAIQNNRYDAGKCFARIASTVWDKVEFSNLIADLLSQLKPNGQAFIAAYLDDYSLPPNITSALEAEAPKGAAPQNPFWGDEPAFPKFEPRETPSTSDGWAAENPFAFDDEPDAPWEPPF